jgi:hypothetical protein
MLWGCRTPGQGGVLFKKSAHRVLPCLRFAAFLNAVLLHNDNKILTLDEMIRGALSALGRNDRTHENALQFFEKSARNWLWQLLQLHLWDARGDHGLEAFEEPKHNDGGASCSHLSYTLAGPRSLQCEIMGGAKSYAPSFDAASVGQEERIACEDGKGYLTLQSEAGTLYWGGMVACKHQVFHPRRSRQDSLLVGGAAMFCCCAMPEQRLLP